MSLRQSQISFREEGEGNIKRRKYLEDFAEEDPWVPEDTEIQDRNLGVISIKMAFKSVEIDESIKGDSVKREEKRVRIVPWSFPAWRDGVEQYFSIFF